MIEIEEARYALSVAREHAEEGNYAACAAVVEKLITMFPSSYRFGRDVALAIGAPEWGIDWAGLDAEIMSAINAQLIEHIRAKEARAKQAKKVAKLPRSSKYPEAMKQFACGIANLRPNSTPSTVSVFVLDKMRTEAATAGWDCLPSKRTIANWIKKHRSK